MSFPLRDLCEFTRPVSYGFMEATLIELCWQSPLLEAQSDLDFAIYLLPPELIR